MFGDAGARIVVEERIEGREVSFFVLLDGEGYLLLPMALDYPKSDDGNRGVVSAGMGALSPTPWRARELSRAGGEGDPSSPAALISPRGCATTA